MNKRPTLIFAIIFLVLVLIQNSPSRSQTETNVLAQKVAKMSPGQWVVLNEDGDDSGYGNKLTTDGVGGVFGYSQKAVYDPVDDTVWFTGAGHGYYDGHAVGKHIRYSVALNKWEDVGRPPWATGPNDSAGHAYDNPAINPEAREYYTKKFTSGQFHKFNLSKLTWEPMADPVINLSEGSVEYFPQRDELLMLQYWELHKWQRSTDRWSTIERSLKGVGFRSPIMRYSPACQCVLLMGGIGTVGSPTQNFSHAVYRYDKDGKLSQLHDSPEPIMIYINRAVTAVDPVSGNLIFVISRFDDSGKAVGEFEMWEYKVASDSWAKLNIRVPSGWTQREGDIFGVITTSISKYGVIMFMSAAETKSKVYLYRHAPESSTPYIPPPPTPPVSSAVPTRPPTTPASNDVPVIGSAVPFSEKCALSGVLGCWGFDDVKELRYAWDASDGPLNAEMVRRGLKNHVISTQRLATEGNTAAISQPGGALTIPAIDNMIHYSGAGSLQFQIPTRSQANAGFFQDNFNKVLGNPSLYLGPNSPNGNVFYTQFKLRLNDVMLNTTIRELAGSYFGLLSTSGAGSDILITDPALRFEPSFAGREIYILYSQNNFVAGYYRITQFIDATHIKLDRSPTPNGAGKSGFGAVGGDPDTGRWNGVLSTPGRGSNVVVHSGSPYDSFTKGMVGKVFQIRFNGNNFVAGNYTVTEFIDATHLRLNQSPTPAGAGTQGWGVTGRIAGGWKVGLLTGNAPHGFFSYETVMNNGYQLGYPQIYGNLGVEGAPVQRSVTYRANQWQEITIREEVRGPARFTPVSRVTWWVDGVLAGNWETHTIFWGDDGHGGQTGPGQFQMLPYHTNKDLTQDHDTGYMWLDDLIVSTQPIPMTKQ